MGSQSSRTRSDVMSHQKKSIKNSFLFQGKYNELHLLIVCLFFLKYAHKTSYTSRFSDQAKCPRKNIANSTRCAQCPIIVSSFSNPVGLEFFETVFGTETYVFSIMFGTETSLL